MSHREWLRRASSAILWAPVAVAVIYLLQLLRTLGTVRESLASHPDFASAPFLAELMGQRADGAVLTLGDYRWYEALWLLRGTKFLPAHHAVWEAVPFVLWAIGLVAIFVAVRRIASRWAALTAVALVICGGVSMRLTLWSLNTHGPAVIHVTLLSLAVVLLATGRGRPHFWRWALLSAPAIVAVTAFGATDPLLLGVGIAPFAAALLLLAWRTNDWLVGAYGLVVSGASAIGGVVLTKLGDSADMSWTHRPVSFIGADRVADQLGLFPAAMANLIGRSVFGEQVRAATAVSMAGALLGLLAAVVVVTVAVRLVRPAIVSGLGATPATDDERQRAARQVFIGFWLTAALGSTAQFLLTSAAFEINGARYIATVWVAICVLLPLVAEMRDRRVLAAAVGAGVAAVSTLSFIGNPRPTRDAPLPTEAVSQQIEAFARSHGVTRGYGGFWVAMGTTWHTRFDLTVFPIWACPTAERPQRNCPFHQHQISSWYAPGAAGRRLLVVDPRLPLQPALDPAYGKPIAQQTFGTTTVYIFQGDISASIG